MVKHNEYYLGLEEVNAIVASAKNLKESVVLKILAGTGMRRFELANLMVKDVDFDRKRLFIAHGKAILLKILNQELFLSTTIYYKQSNFI